MAHGRSRADRRRDRRRVDRHRGGRLPGHVRTPRGQAGHRGLLRLPRGRARDRVLRLRARSRRRHDPAPRLPIHQLGHRLRRCRLPARLRDDTADPVARGHRHGGVRPDRRGGRAHRGVAATDPAAPAGAGGRARPARVQRHRARVLPLPRHLRGGGRQGVEGTEAAQLDHRGLPAAADGARGVRAAAHPQRDASPPRSPSSSPRARRGGDSTRSTSPTTRHS